MKKVIDVLRWGIGIFFILMGGLSIKEWGIAATLFVILFGLSLIPMTWKKLKEFYPKWKSWQSVLVAVVLFFAWAIALPTTETESVAQVENITETETIYNEEIVTENSIENAESETIAEETTELILEEETELVISLGEMKVHFLDVEQGLSILVQVEDEVLVYDGGDRKTSSYVVAYLKEKNVKEIDYLISSHYDSDHVYGLIGCLNAFDVKNVISSDYEHDSDTYDKFVAAVEKKGLTMQHPKVGTEFSLGNASFVILSPKTISKNDVNANSVAIKLTHGEKSFIFTGDTTIASEANIVKLDMDLECDVLSLGHHGAAISTSWDLLEKTVPEYAVLSCGENNQYGHPDEEVMEKLESMEIELFRTDKQGTIIATSDGKMITWDVVPCNDYSAGKIEEANTEKKNENQGAEASTPKEETTTQKENTSSEKNTTEKQNDTSEQTNVVSEQVNAAESNNSTSGQMVWLSATGEKYHSINNCGRMNPAKARQVTLEYAVNNGYQACSKCH